MKRFTYIIVIIMMIFSLTGCGDSKVFNNIKYETYGLFNKEENKNPKIKYKIITGNIVWAIILSETIVAPIYFVCFDLYEPVRELNISELENKL